MAIFLKKIFFIMDQKDSFLYKDNIDTISFNKFDKLTIRYLNFCKLKNTELGNLPLNLNFKKNLFIFEFFSSKIENMSLKIKYCYLRFFLNFIYL